MKPAYNKEDMYDLLDELHSDNVDGWRQRLQQDNSKITGLERVNKSLKNLAEDMCNGIHKFTQHDFTAVTMVEAAINYRKRYPYLVNMDRITVSKTYPGHGAIKWTCPECNKEQENPDMFYSMRFYPDDFGVGSTWDFCFDEMGLEIECLHCKKKYLTGDYYSEQAKLHPHYKNN